MKYFKVKIGYKDDEFISIDQSELKKALIAQVNGSIAIFNEGSIAGNSIISITPDYNREMGYNRDYRLGGEDYEHIGSKRVEESRMMIENAYKEASVIQNNPIIGDAAKLLADKFRLK
jgi:hypothetical protein